MLKFVGGSGVLLVDKPSGLSSARVVSIVKKRLGAKKLGHAGTLDPLATGLLVLLVNSATKLSDRLMGGDKVYSGVIRFGVRTTTDDIDGEVLETQKVRLDKQQLADLIVRFIGEIDQMPPSVSALKVAGVRAYKLAREGKKVDLKPRKVRIDDFWWEMLDNERIRFRLSCSKGTYIRSIARDLGVQTGFGAVIEELRREVSLPFEVSDAVSLEEVCWENLIVSDKLEAMLAEPQQSVLGSQATRSGFDLGLV